MYTPLLKCPNYITFNIGSIADADSAVRALHNIKVLDASLGALQVKYAVGEVARLGLSNANSEPGVDQVKLFIGSVPKTITEEQIKKVFGEYGQVEEVFIMKDLSTGLSKGCAFVKMSYKEQGLYAIKMADGKLTIDNSKPLEVRFAEAKGKQQNAIPGVPIPNIGVGAMARPFQPGVPRQIGVWREYISPDGRPYYFSEQTGLTQWEVPPEFQMGPISTVNAMGMHMMPPSTPFDQTVMHMNNITNALYNKQPNATPCGSNGVGQFGPPGANLFIFHIPYDWYYADLVKTFSQFGTIVSARIATDKGTGRNRGFAFVSYSTVESAVKAITCMNGFIIANKKLKVTVKKGEEQYISHLLPSVTANVTPYAQM